MTTTATDIAALVAAARIEVIPVADIVEQVTRSVPRGSTLTITCLPAHGPERSVATAVDLVAHGYAAVPHLAARSVGSRTELRELVARCRDAGIDEYVVVGGDRHAPAGPYSWASSLMEDLLELAGPGVRIGVGGYPEVHPGHRREELAQAIRHKQALGATSIVTQLCFDASALARWLDELTADGIRLPVSVGVPGVVRRARLIEMSTRIGVAGALGFVRGNRRSLVRLLVHRQFRPDRLIATLVAADGPGRPPIEGLHLYSFNEVAHTAAWQARLAARAPSTRRAVPEGARRTTEP